MSLIGNIDIVDPREDKLPRWARAKLSDARRHVANERQKAEEALLNTDPAGSLVVVDNYHYQIGLGDQVITFKPRLGADRFQSIVVRAHRGGVEVRQSSGGTIHVIPSSSNVVYIRPGEW